VVAIDTIDARDTDSPFDNMSQADVRDLQAGLRTLTGVGAADELAMVLIDADRPAERVTGAYVTGNTFALLGVRPALGRDFTAADDRPGAAPVAILGHRIWQTRFRGDPAVLGRAVRIDEAVVTIVGVMPDRFGFPTQAELWVPLSVRDDEARTDRGARQIDAFGRLADGVTRAQATTELEAVMGRLAAAYPATNTGITPRVRPFRDTNTGGPVRITIAALMGAVALLLLIACANVANLLLARGAMRSREMALRLSLGATRRRLVSQLLIESALLSALGAAIGVPLSFAAVRAVRAAIRGTGEPYWLEFPFDLRVLAFIIGLTVVTAVLFGLLPALRTSRRELVEAIGDGGRTVAGHVRNRRWIGGLVVAQVALALTLMTGAGLMLRNVQIELNIDAGVDTTELIAMQIDLPQRTYPDAASRHGFYQRLDEQLASLPGVAAGSGTWAPLGGAFFRPVTLDTGGAGGDAGPPPRVSNLMIGTTYFGTIGIRPLRGRSFTAADNSPGTAVAIVNQHFASRFFGRQEALGRRIALPRNGNLDDTGWLTIVGIVPNVRHDESDARIVESVVYLPHGSAPLPFSRIVFRGTDVAAATGAVRAAVARLDATLAGDRVAHIRDTWAANLWPFVVFGSLFAAFGAVALVLVAVGLYGVTAYSVAMRVRELGVRIALGASARHVMWVATRSALVQLAIGLTFGILGAALAGLAIRGLLHSIAPYDPVTLAVVALVCVGAALAACIGPAQRALRTDPIAVLRES
jgi:putative ABC transport system permease protein